MPQAGALLHHPLPEHDLLTTHIPLSILRVVRVPLTRFTCDGCYPRPSPAPAQTMSASPTYVRPAPPLCTDQFVTDVMKPLSIADIIDNEVQNLSGGELQRVAIALSLGKPADIYLIDEPSAYLDSEQVGDVHIRYWSM